MRTYQSNIYEGPVLQKRITTHLYLTDQEKKMDNSCENMFNSSRYNENIILHGR